jgi:hypothetical protein
LRGSAGRFRQEYAVVQGLLLTVVSRAFTILARIGVLAAALAAAQPTSAQQAAPQQPPSSLDDPEPWRLRATLYGWLMSVGGSLTARGQTVDVNASFVDLLQKSDSLAGFMGYFEADKGRVGFFTDAVFARLGFTSTMVNYRNPVAGLKVSTTANTGLTYSMAIIESGGTYELARWSGSAGSATALDALAGFRLWNQTVDLNLDVLGTVDFSRLGFQRGFGFSTASSGNLTWVDPVVGLRLRHQFTPSQDIMLMGDIGGFGLQSSLTWQAVAAYNYAWQFTGYQLAAVVGFRALGVNYSAISGDPSNGINMVLYGPIVGGSIRF